MSGLGGISRLPRDTVRARRNATKFASQFTSMLGDGLTVDGGLIVVDLAADKGLEFLAGDLATKIQAPLICDAAGLGIDPGNGLEISGTELVVDLAADKGLEFLAGDLTCKVAAPMALDATGIHLDYTTGLTLDGTDLVVDDTVFVPYTGATADLDLGAHNFITTGLGTFGTQITTPLLETAGTTDVLHVQPDATGTGVAMELFENVSVGDRPKIKIWGRADAYSTTNYAEMYVDTCKRLCYGGTIGSVFYSVPLSARTMIFGGTRAGFFDINRGGILRHMIFGTTKDAYDDPVWVMTSWERRASNFNVESTSYPQIWLHDGSATLTNSLKISWNAIRLLDNSKIRYGTGDDASIYYDGTDLWIDSDEVGTGSLKIGEAVNYVEVEPDGDIVFHGTANLAANSIAVPQLAVAVQDLMPNLNITAAAEVVHVRTITIQARDAANNNLAERFLVRVWVSTTDYGAPSAADNTIAVGTGTIYEVETAHAAYKVISDGDGEVQIDVEIAGVATRYIMAEIDGRIYSSGAITWAG